MPELVERGHVHRRAAALPGEDRRPRAVRREGVAVRGLLVRERIGTWRFRSLRPLAEALRGEVGRFQRALHDFEGWSTRLRTDFGAPAANFVVAHRLVETDAEDLEGMAKALASIEPNGFEVAVIDTENDAVRVKVVERETSSAEHIFVPAALLSSPVYAGLRKSYARLQETMGPPPFTISLGKKRSTAETFEDLRHRAIDIAKEGIQVSRFKGLGEMDAEELAATTMDPAKGCSSASTSRTRRPPT